MTTRLMSSIVASSAGGEHEELLVVSRQPADRRDLVVARSASSTLSSVSFAAFSRSGSTMTDTSRSSLAATSTRPTPGMRESDGRRSNRAISARVHRRQPPGEVVAEDREDRRRHSFDDDFSLRRQDLARLVHLALHQLQGLLHVGVRVEQHRDLGRATDGLRANPAGAEHAAGGFLERPGDGDRHHLRRQIARVSDDRNPRKLGLGVDAARQHGERIGARKRRKRHAEDDDARVMRGEPGNFHCGFAIFTESPRPWTPVVRMDCASSTPLNTSTLPSSSSPVLTGVRVAVSPLTR